MTVIFAGLPESVGYTSCPRSHAFAGQMDGNRTKETTFMGELLLPLVFYWFNSCQNRVIFPFGITYLTIRA